MTKTDLLQEGIYRGVVTKWGLYKSSVKGTPYVDFGLLLTHRAAAGGRWDELPVPVVRNIQVYFTFKSMWLAVADLRRLGFEDPEIRKLDPGYEEAHDFAGTEVEVSLAREACVDGQGKSRCHERLRLPRLGPAGSRRS